MIIGIAGYARSGKDTIADILVERHDFTKIAFADKLREGLYWLNPMVSTGEQMIKDYDPRNVRVRWVIDRYSWDNYKETPWGEEIRELLQRLGTEVGRNLLGENIWVEALDWHAADNIVIPDMRFPNEIKAVESRRGFTWRVRRPGVGPANAHSSETALDHWPVNIDITNDGSIEELAAAVSRNYELNRAECNRGRVIP